MLSCVLQVVHLLPFLGVVYWDASIYEVFNGTTENRETLLGNALENLYG